MPWEWNTSPGTIQRALIYDADYAIDAIASSAATGLKLDFGVDVLGNVTEASAALNPPVPDRRYGYDALHRLTTAQTGATPPAPQEAYTYGPTGDAKNRKKQSKKQEQKTGSELI